MLCQRGGRTTKVTLEGRAVLVKREDGDPDFYSDSTFLLNVKRTLNDMGFDFIKKRMWKDGHLVDEEQQYLRERKTKDAKMIWWSNYAIYNAFLDWNEGGRVILSLMQ